jgi:hypothetical protein
MYLRQLSFTTLVLLTASLPARAAKLKTWHAQGQTAFAGAHFENMVIGNQGTIQLAHLLKPLVPGKIDAGQIWDLLEDHDGRLIVATGGDGKLLRVDPAGDVTVLYENKSGPILCLAAGPDGDIFAGTGPDGRILRLTAKGEVRPLCDTAESYIWAMVYQPAAKALFAATGPHGRVLKITLDGKASTFLQTKQDHVLCLAAGTAGKLYAGTDKQGLIYRIDPSGKGFVLYQTPQGEVHTLLVTPEALYAGTSAPTKKRGSAAVAASITSTAVVKEQGDKGTVQASGPSSPGSGDNSVYRIATDGSVREIFRDKAQMLCLAKLGDKGDKLLVGTGMDGKLFEVDETTRDFAEIARPDAGQIIKLVRRADGSIILGTGDAGLLFTLQDGVAVSGQVLSEAFDAKLISKWGSLTWRADAPTGSSVAVSVRGGNTSEPDATWSDWSDEFASPAKAVFAGPACRFAQFRVVMKSDGKASPALHSVSLRYATINQAPEVTSIEAPDLDAAPLKEPKKLKIKWSALDPNEDELTFDIYVRKDGWNDWARVEENWGKTEYEWDTTTTPSGVYQVKIVASDRADNPEGSALTGSRISAPILVAHEAPRVTLKATAIAEGVATLEATAAAPLVRLASADFALNGKRWESVFPTDGLFDGKEKAFRFQTAALTPGTYVMVLRVKDVAGNVGSADVVFSVPKR